jgi:2-phospho-L-lactate/phosphoenolpyruvate guanylyltransferase
VIFAVLPVKSPRNAKQRLSGFLSADQRETLARILYRQTLASLCQAEGIDRVVVVTSDSEIAEHARRSGALVFDENAQVSHSVSADAACLRAIQLGATTVLLVPIDVPLVTPADFTRLAVAARPRAHGSPQGSPQAGPQASSQPGPQPKLIVVPSADGTGTNALARTPPDVIESRFGPGSCRAHLDQARSKSVHSEVLRLRGLMFDIDTPEDVAEFLAGPHESDAAAFLRTVCASK